MNIFQIGAAGGIGRHLTPLLIQQGHTVTGMHRSLEQSEVIASAGANPVLGDLVLDSVEELADKVSGHDAIVFSAGAHGTGRDMTTLIDGVGVEKAAAAAEGAGVSRFVLVSVFPDAERDAGLGEGFEHYARVKKAADVHLTHTGLDWLIVRPGLLLDDPGSGLVAAGPAVEYRPISRGDVAAFIAAALAEPNLSRRIIELTGGTTPVPKAVSDLAAT